MIMEEKYCKGCDKILPRSDFHKNGSTTHPTCKICRQEERRAQKNPRKDGIKYCPGCEIEHPTSEFNSDKGASDGLQSYCRKQKTIQNLKYLSTYEGFMKHLFTDLRSNAKKRNIQVEIALDDIKQLYISQNGKCALSDIKMTHQATDRTNEHNQHIMNKWNISVDRIDSSKHYIKNNIQLVCAIINRIKFGLPEKDFLLISGGIVERNFNKINNIIQKEFNFDFINKSETSVNKSLIIDILDELAGKEKQNIVGLTPMQKWSCSYNGFIKKLYLTLVHNTDRRAKKTEIDITEQTIKELYQIQEGKCKITGKYMSYIGYQNNGLNKWNISVNRIDSNKNYTKDNIQLVCAIVNTMKSDLTNDELLMLSNNIPRKNFNKISNLITEYIIKM